ncbi:MAG: BatA domain-containing protein, partial [Deltaproteobacteria bacterium]|nr:BatA domain-containing protein [Deltaproteobacteria bacterium]
MSFFFLHPLYLLALAATAIPLLIHLLNRRKVKRIRFPAVRFVLLSQRRISRSYRLRHWILLALRTFAVFLLVLLLAHPIFRTGAGLFAGGGPLSAVILLDNSLSMKWSGGSEGFKQAKDAARLLISSLNDGDRAAVVPTNRLDKSPIRLKGEKEILSRDAEAVQVSAGTADFSAALARAYELLREPAAQREIWLLTDMALTGWENFTIAALGQHDPLIPLKILRIGGKEEPLNATLKEVKMRGHGVGVGLPIHLEASVVNFGDREIKDLLVQLYIDERNREQKLISVPPKAEVGVGFVLQLARPGEHQGYVALKKDGLAGNPISYFTLQAQDKLRVLVVDGDPQTALVQSETFFLARALNPAGERDSS